MKYQHLPTEIEAICFTGDNTDEIGQFVIEHTDPNRDQSNRPVTMITNTTVSYVGVWVEKVRCHLYIVPGDYVLAERDGVSVCHRDLFEAKYAPADG